MHTSIWLTLAITPGRAASAAKLYPHASIAIWRVATHWI